MATLGKEAADSKDQPQPLVFDTLWGPFHETLALRLPGTGGE